MINVKIEDPNLRPIKKHSTDAGWDLKSTEEHIIESGDKATIHTGTYFEIPAGYVGMVYPRSGKACDEGLTLRNTVGIIDADYRGEIIIKIKNNERFALHIAQYERFAQIVIVPVLLEELNVLSELTITKRGSSGFGDSGKI